MVEAALAVAIAAIAITLFGVILQWLAYGATVEQAQRAAQSTADMRAEIHDLVGELRGITGRMVEAQERQFNRMLDAFVTRPGAAAEAAEKASQSAVTAEEVGGMLEALREEVEKAASPGPMLARLEALERRLDDVRESSAAAARFAGAASRPSFADSPYLRLGREGELDVSIDPLVMQPGGRVTLKRFDVPTTLTSLLDEDDCEVTTPDGRALTRRWPRQLGQLVFPDDFRHGSTELEGDYRVTVRREPLFSFTEQARPSVFRGRFHVRSGEAE